MNACVTSHNLLHIKEFFSAVNFDQHKISPKTLVSQFILYAKLKFTNAVIEGKIMFAIHTGTSRVAEQGRRIKVWLL